MLSLYIITINDSAGRLGRHSIVSETLAEALAKARERAGVDDTVEPKSTQHMEDVDEVIVT